MKKFMLPLVMLLVVSSIVMFMGCKEEAVDDPVPIDNSALDAQVKAANDSSAGNTYLVGAGIYDITGPAAEVGMMGFADDTQNDAGISMRLRSRAFVVGDGTNRIVFVSADTWAMSQMAKMRIGEKLAADPIMSKHYSLKNVCVSATHTHSAPAGFDGYFLYDTVPRGFIKQSFDAIVNGVYNSIVLAHNNAELGKILVSKGELDKAGWNRSPRMYENNPDAEKALYDSNTDKSMTLLKFVNLSGAEIGMVNWYAIHPTSVGAKNYLITGDNKGHASYLFEKDKGTNYQAAKTYVAAFALANAGDVTPNVPFTAHLGSVEKAMEAAEINRATAVAEGFPWPEAKGEADIEQNLSLKLSATRQYAKAKELYNAATENLKGSVEFRHEWIDMRTLYVKSQGVTTCPGGMGASYSFGSPAENPTPFPLFPEGLTVDNINWSTDSESAFLVNFLPGVISILYPAVQSEAYKACQYPKPVILATGLMTFSPKNIPLTPQILPLQVLKIGNLAIAAIPTEITTMAGRRIKNTLLDSLKPVGVKYSVIASHSNTYASYLATKEEYQLQGYEGAGTFFGPNQLAAFQQEFAMMCDAIVNGKAVPEGTAPADITGDTVNFTTDVVLDDKPSSVEFGSVFKQPAKLYKRGDIVNAVFWGGHPRNNLMTQKTYLEIEKVNLDGSTTVVARDWDPETKYIWQRDSAAYSKITIVWNTKNAKVGTYRIRHLGHWKSVGGVVTAYTGETQTFVLL